MLNHKLIGCLSFSLLVVQFAAANTHELQEAEKNFVFSYIQKRPIETTYRQLENINKNRAQTLKKQADAVEHIFNEVLKTEKQLVPKQCNYLVAYGYEGSNPENLKKACDNLRLAAFANMDRPSMKIYIAGSKHIREALQAALKRTPMPQERVFEIGETENSKTAQAIIPLILKDSANKRYNMENMLYRRILLLTAASNIRISYASFIAALGKNEQQMLLDDFSSLDMPRKQLDSPSFEEREKAFNELLVPFN